MAGTKDDLPAFPGAEGFGADADGGRGGEVVTVTTLADSGEGSLRWALEEREDPRIVVFDVGGTIELEEQIQINGDVTIAGQTAPGGVTVTGGRLRVVESDVIMRGLHVRPGDDDGQNGESRDGISVGKRGALVEDVMIDSNSVSWAVDENMATWGAPSDVTFSNNIVAQALRDSIHPKGEHSMGMLIGDGSSNVSVLDNLFAHNMYRNPTIKDDSKQIEFVNNVIYNYGPNGFLGSEGTTAHVIGNVYIPGADSAERAAILLRSPENGTAYYLEDNVGDVAGPAASKMQASEVFAPSEMSILPSGEVVEHVLSSAGAQSAARDAVDSRIVESVRQGSGSLVDSPEEAGGPAPAPTARALPDGDGDAIPDVYERIIGSDPAEADARQDANQDGYADIETYINGLLAGFDPVSDTTPGRPALPEPTGPDAGTSPPDGSEARDAASGDRATGPGGGPPETPSRTADGAATGGQESAPRQAEAALPPPLRIEAEDFDFVQGFRAEGNPHASGDELIRADGDGEQTAETVFDGPSGIYDIAVDYFDETDGESVLELSVDEEPVDRWTWNQDLGNPLVTPETATTRVIEDVRLDRGEDITLTGTPDGSEPLRIDQIELLADMIFG